MAQDESPGSDRVRQALRLLADEARDRMRNHPSAHLMGEAVGTIDVPISVPTDPGDADLDKAVAQTVAGIDESIRGIVAYRSAFQPGRVLCLRCRSASCEHAAPIDGRHVFAGYGSTGIPQYVELGKWLLDRKDPRVDLLYAPDRPHLLADVASGKTLTSDLLQAFRDRERGFFLHGQVVAGLYRLPDAGGLAQPVALTLQVVSSRSRRSRRRLGLNVVSAGPDGTGLAAVAGRVEELPWRAAVRWAQSRLEGIERSINRKGRTPERVVRERVDRLLRELARRLEQGQRSRERRTQHAQVRHEGGDRPTRMARADLAKANDAALLYDTRRGTLVVVGERGRVHFFSPGGKHVTSVQYAPEAIERRRRSELWRAARPDEISSLRASIAREEEPARRGEGS